jgi:hypothetical protein
MGTCEICGKKFHTCSSCNKEFDWEYCFCCKEHYHQSEGYQKFYQKSMELVESLSTDKKTLLWDLLDDGEDSASILRDVLEAWIS